VRTVAVVAVAALMVTAGCVGSLGGNDNGSANGTQDGTTTGDAAGPGTPGTSDVPAKAHMIASYDTGLVTDETSQAVANAYLDQVLPEDSDRSRTVGAYLDRMEKAAGSETDLSTDDIGGMTMFVEYPSMGSMMGPSEANPGEQYVGVLLQTDWESDKVTSLIEQQSEELEQRTYKGTTIYTGTGTGMGAETGTETETKGSLANYGDGKWVFGTPEAVEDVIDVESGDAEPVSGQLEQAYGQTPSDAYVRFASVVPTEYRQMMQMGMQSQAGMGGNYANHLANVSAVAGSYYTDGGADGTVGMNVVLQFANEKSATSLASQANGFLSLARGSTSNETLRTQIDAMEIGSQGNSVTIEYESSVADLETMIEQFVSPTAGMGMGMEMSPGGPSAGQVRAGFATEYDRDTGTVSATLVSTEAGFDGSNVVARCGSRNVEVPDDLSVGQTITAENCEPGSEFVIIYRGSSGTRVLHQYVVPEGETSSDGQYSPNALVG
jgi:hypothetical protein